MTRASTHPASGGTMKDQEILSRIGRMVDEEHALLRQSGEQHGLNDDQEARLQGLEIELDQCWDLLQQRRARREFGLNPDDAKARDASTVERYDPNWQTEAREEPRHEP